MRKLEITLSVSGRTLHERYAIVRYEYCVGVAFGRVSENGNRSKRRQHEECIIPTTRDIASMWHVRSGQNQAPVDQEQPV